MCIAIFLCLKQIMPERNIPRFWCSRGTLKGEIGASFRNTIVYSNTCISGSEAEVKNSSTMLKNVFEQLPPQPVYFQKEKTSTQPDKSVMPQLCPPEHPLTGRDTGSTCSSEGLNYPFPLPAAPALPAPRRTSGLYVSQNVHFFPPSKNNVFNTWHSKFYHAFNRSFPCF